MKATFVREIISPAGAAQRLYRLSEPITWGGDYEGGAKGTADHLIVSATVAMFSGPETYIFPANEDGTVLDWGELPGSLRGTLSHDEVLSAAGYEIT
jgi:hypothetical protein